MQTLGTLEKVGLRDIWANESMHFTPWLAQKENLQLLGKSIGLRLELEAQEKEVGPFRADILCKDLTDDTWVLIENQLERTDHCHLGQLITYAAGLSTVTIVWIAERFTDEHRAALDWLNENTPEQINFFGLEVELWKIGNSPVAPKFNVVCKPNEWTRTVKESTDHPDLKQFCWEYWSGVLKELEPAGILGPEAKPSRRQDTQFDVGLSTFRLKAFFSLANKELGVWLACRGPAGYENFLKIQQNRPAIEKQFGNPLKWDSDEPKNRGYITHITDGYDASNRNDWPRQHKLIAKTLMALYSALRPHLAALDIKEDSEGPSVS
jgi:hypothetical protein